MSLDSIVVKGDGRFLSKFIATHHDSYYFELSLKSSSELQEFDSRFHTIMHRVKYIHIPTKVATSEGEKNFSLVDDNELGVNSKLLLSHILRFLSDNKDYFFYNTPFKGVVAHTDMDNCDLNKNEKKYYQRNALCLLLDIFKSYDFKVPLLLENNPLHPVNMIASESAYCTLEDLDFLLSGLGEYSSRIGLALDIEHLYKTAITKAMHEELVEFFKKDEQPDTARENAIIHFRKHASGIDFVSKANEYISEFFKKHSSRICSVHSGGYDPINDHIVFSGGVYLCTGSHLPPGYEGKQLRIMGAFNDLHVKDRIDHTHYLKCIKDAEKMIDVVLKFDVFGRDKIIPMTDSINFFESLKKNI